MKIISKIILTVILSAAVASVVKAQIKTVTLDQVLDMVINSSFAQRTASLQKQGAEQSYLFYRSQLRPTLSLTADIPNYSKTSAPVTQPDGSISFQSIRQANSNIGLSASQVISATGGTLFATSQINRFDDYSNEFKQYNGIPVRIGIIQPIIGFNPWKYRKRIEPLLLQEAEKTYQVSIEEALLTATRLYFDILIADQNLKIAQSNRGVNENLLNITNERFTLGKVSKDEQLQLKMELNQSRLQVSQASYSRSEALVALYSFLGMEADTTAIFTTPSKLEPASISIPDVLAAYSANRPEVIAYQRELAEAESGIAEAKAMFGLGATIRASYGLARGADNVTDIYTDPFTEQQANLSISVPILDWGRKKTAVAQQVINKQNIEANYEQQLLELEANIKQRCYLLGSLQRELILLKDIMDTADTRAQISNERYVLGDIDITNLTIAQREKDQAKRTYINALQTYWTTYYQLRALTGYDVITDSPIIYQ